MAGHNAAALAVAQALQSQGDLREATAALYEQLGDMGGRAAIFDVGRGPDGYLVAIPGWTPQSSASLTLQRFVFLGRLM